MGTDIDNQLNDIDKTNVNLIMFYENNVNIKKQWLTFTNPFKKTTRIIVDATEKPEYDIEIRIDKKIYNSNLYEIVKNFKQFPIDFLRDLITDGNFVNNNFDQIFIGYNYSLNKNTYEYIIIANIDTKRDTVSNIFMNFNLQKDNYNDEIYSMNYKQQNVYLSSKNNQLFISPNKNSVFEASNINSKIQLQHKGIMSINISDKFTNFFNMALRQYAPNINIEYLSAYIEESEKYKLNTDIVCSDKNTADSLYDIFSGLKQASNGILKLYSGNLPMIIPNFINQIVISSLTNSNIKRKHNTVSIEFIFSKDLINPLLFGF